MWLSTMTVCLFYLRSCASYTQRLLFLRKEFRCTLLQHLVWIDIKQLRDLCAEDAVVTIIQNCAPFVQWLSFGPSRFCLPHRHSKWPMLILTATNVIYLSPPRRQKSTFPYFSLLRIVFRWSPFWYFILWPQKLSCMVSNISTKALGQARTGVTSQGLN